jgi:hypothetical protein
MANKFRGVLLTLALASGCAAESNPPPASEWALDHSIELGYPDQCLTLEATSPDVRLEGPGCSSSACSDVGDVRVDVFVRRGVALAPGAWAFVELGRCD